MSLKWYKVFPTLEAANETIPQRTAKLVLIGDHRICLANTNKGFRAIQDHCPHNGEALHKGKFNFLDEIICPWHGYRFDLSSGREGDGKCSEAKIYPVKAEGGLFIGIS